MTSANVNRSSLLSARLHRRNGLRRKPGRGSVRHRPLRVEQLEPRLLLTDVSGHITADTVWNNTSEPYRLVGDLFIDAGKKLTLASGVTLQTDNEAYDIFVDGRLESNGATIELLYNNTTLPDSASLLEVRTGGTLVMAGGTMRGPGLLQISDGATANLTDVVLAYYNGGTNRVGSPDAVYKSGSAGTLDNAHGNWDLVVDSPLVSIVNRIDVNSLSLTVPIFVDGGSIDELYTSASASVANATIGFVRLNGGVPSLRNNDFTNGAPFRVTDPDFLKLSRVYGNTYLAADPRIDIAGTLNGSLALNIVDGAVTKFQLSDYMTVATGATLSIGAGVTLRIPGTQQLDVSRVQEVRNDGIIDLRSSTAGNVSRFLVGSSTTLTGSGELKMSSVDDKVVGGTGTRLVIGPSQTVHGTGAIDANVTNQGLLQSDVTAKPLVVTGTVTNEGTIRALNGATINLQGAVTNRGVIQTDGPNIDGSYPIVDIDAGLTTWGSGILAGVGLGTIRVGGDLLGYTSNRDLYAFRGNVRLDKAATAAAPHFIEAMSEDLGPVQAGFIDNFSLWELRLENNNYVRIIDGADNVPGGSSEAIYVDKLIVHAGSTLDLNGRKVYARTYRIDGTLVGGTIIQVPGGGEMELNRLTSGSISVPGEVDEWTFFGRADHTVQMGLQTNDVGNTPPITPRLGAGRTTLLDVNGNVLTTDGNPVTLTADGTYRMRVQADSGNPNATGNYFCVAWDTTRDVSTLVLGRQTVGTIESPFSENRWVFSAAQNSQIQLTVNAVPGFSIGFDLTGPNGWVGFTDIETNSGLINLPHSGEYTLTASTLKWQYDVAYSFRLETTQETELALGIPYIGQLASSAQAQLFRLPVSTPSAVVVSLTDDSLVNSNELYMKLGSPPTRAEYDYRSDPSRSANQEIILTTATAQDWYILVYSPFVGAAGPFTLLATGETFALTDVTPNRHGDSIDAVLTLEGVGFVGNVDVELVAADGTSYALATAAVDLSSQITAVVPAHFASPGLYDLRIQRADGRTSVLEDAFTVTEGGHAELHTDLTLPSSLGYHQLATIYIEYENRGDVAMPAPLLSFTVLQPTVDEKDLPTAIPAPPLYVCPPRTVSDSNGDVKVAVSCYPNPYTNNSVPDGGYLAWLSYYRGYLAQYYRQDAILTLDASRVKSGFWTSAMPEGFSNTVSVLAHGEIPGLLQPGEKGRIPVYWAGWRQPWDHEYRDFEFSLEESTTTDSTPIDVTVHCAKKLVKGGCLCEVETETFQRSLYG